MSCYLIVRASKAVTGMLLAGVLPKSTNPDHVRQNIQLDFDLSPEELQTLSKLSIRKKYTWDPAEVV